MAAFMLLPGILRAQYVSQVWSPDNGDGTYTNPVLYADYSDPDVCAVGDDYYLTASSFNCIPGLPILHSRDLVNWEIIGHALKEQKPESVFAMPAHGKGVWAPAIRWHEGEFYIYWGDPDRGIMMTKSADPRGDWSEPVCVVAGQGMIDPCPLWDDDGRCYLVNGWAGSRSGFNSVLTLRELSADGTRPIGAPCIVFDGGQTNHTAEGPKLYKRDGWYWILCPAGGVQQGWQLAMRSRSVYGPYECQMVLAQGTTGVNGPHQGAWVHTPEEEDWFLHFQDRGAYGRVVFLQPVTWKDNWPVVGRPTGNGYCGEPYISYRKPKVVTEVKVNPQESDEFNTTRLGLQWQWQANYSQMFGMPTNNGCMRLYTYYMGNETRNLWDAPNLLLQKLPAPSFTVIAKLRFASTEEGQYGGVVMMGADYEALTVCRRGNAFDLELRHCKDADTGGAESVDRIVTLKATACDTIPYSPAIYLDIYMRMTVADGRCRMAYSTDGKNFKDVGSPFVMRQGRWTGAKMGFVSQTSQKAGNRGWVDADWFRVVKP